ncbi:serine/threonine-protein kinase [Actinocorallia lasiicapitis]
MREGLELGGRYRLTGLLGRGGMGEVWRARDGRLNRDVAVKLLPVHEHADAASVARFRREAEIAAAISHPGITTVFDIDEQDGLLYLVMELLQGSDLEALLRSHPSGLPIGQVTAIAEGLLDALATAHAAGVIHRDLKPANVMLLPSGRIKLCDFGIAGLSDATRITRTGMLAGTPLYMAPEQFRGARADPRTDLYATGCLLYSLLTGSPWIDPSDGLASVLYQQLETVPVPPRERRPEIPEHLDALVVALLAKDPATRPSSAEETARSLTPPTEPAFAPPPAPAPTPPPPPVPAPASASADVSRSLSPSPGAAPRLHESTLPDPGLTAPAFEALPSGLRGSRGTKARLSTALMGVAALAIVLIITVLIFKNSGPSGIPGATAAGTVLKVGETAHVPLQRVPYGGARLLDVTVTKFERLTTDWPGQVVCAHVTLHNTGTTAIAKESFDRTLARTAFRPVTDSGASVGFLAQFSDEENILFKKKTGCGTFTEADLAPAATVTATLQFVGPPPMGTAQETTTGISYTLGPDYAVRWVP